MLVADFAVGAAIEQEDLGSWACSYGLSQALHDAVKLASACVPGMPGKAGDAGRFAEQPTGRKGAYANTA